MIQSTGDVGRHLDSLQPFPLRQWEQGRDNPRKKCAIKGCKRQQRLRAFYTPKSGTQERVGVCPEHACDIVNAYIDKVIHDA